MAVELELPAGSYRNLRHHLLPKFPKNEEVVFVFVDSFKDDETLTFRFKDWYPLKPEDYVSRSASHLELTNQIKAEMIKKAHELGCSLIEFHSHLGQKSAKFSPTDWYGFEEFVPHVMWRLKGKPYCAVVVTTRSLDALVWIDKGADPISLSRIAVEGKTFTPTNNSIDNKVDRYE